LRRKCDLFPYVPINLAITLIAPRAGFGVAPAARGQDAPHLLELGKCLVNAPAKCRPRPHPDQMGRDIQAWLAAPLPSAACAAASRAIGTRNGEHET
jgi:hypothetical protein